MLVALSIVHIAVVPRVEIAPGIKSESPARYAHSCVHTILTYTLEYLILARTVHW